MIHVFRHYAQLSYIFVLAALVMLSACAGHNESVEPALSTLGESFELDVRGAQIQASKTNAFGEPDFTPDPAARFDYSFKFLRSGDKLSWRLQGVEPGRYQVQVSAKADLYEGPPQLTLSTGETSATETFEDETYQKITYGTFEIDEGQELSIRFENDRWGGSLDKDRNIAVDHLVLERVTVTEPEPDPEEPDTDAPEVCEEGGVCADGRGLQLYETKAQKLYKNENGWVSMPDELPSALNGTDFLSYDKYPDYGGDDSGYTDNLDSRTDETIARVQSDSDGQLLIAVDSPDAADNGWERLNAGSDADFVLDTEDDSTPSY